MNKFAASVLGVILALVGCTTYGIGSQSGLSSRDAAMAYAANYMPSADRSGVRFDKALSPISIVLPSYPYNLMAAQIANNAEVDPKGRADIRFTIGKGGDVTNIVIVSQTNRAFGQAAITAVRQWRFYPITVGGEPREMAYQVPFFFELK